MLDAIANDDPQKMYEATKSAISTSCQMANENAERNRRRNREYSSRSFEEDMENAKQAVEVTGKLLEVEKEMIDVLIDMNDWVNRK